MELIRNQHSDWSLFNESCAPGCWTAGWSTWMDVDGLEVDVNVEGLEGGEEAAAEDGEGRGLLCGADGPGGDMNEEEDEVEEDGVRLMFSGLWEAKTSRERFSIGIFRPSNGREHSEQT